MSDDVPFEESHTPIRVLIAVTIRLYRDGLLALLSEHRRLQVSGVSGSFLEVQQAARDINPSVVVVDASRGETCALIRSVREVSPNSRILTFAVEDDLSSIIEFAQAGADGFFTARGSVSELVEAICRTASGELVCSAKLGVQLLERATHVSLNASKGVNHGLTAREQQVFILLKQGRSNKEIASALKISHATVKNHVHRLLEKTQVRTRGQVIAAVELHSAVRPSQSTLSSRNRQSCSAVEPHLP